MKWCLRSRVFGHFLPDLSQSACDWAPHKPRNITPPTTQRAIALIEITLQWRHNGCDGISNHQPHFCLLNRLFRRRSKKTPKLRVTGLCAGNSPVTGEFPAQIASSAENVSFWWRHHATYVKTSTVFCRMQFFIHVQTSTAKPSLKLGHLWVIQPDVLCECNCFSLQINYTPGVWSTRDIT